MESVGSKIQQLKGSSFFRKCSKLNLNYQNAKKKWERVFCFWGNCIWRCCNILSLLTREYLSSAVNGLTNSRNIFYISLRVTFSNWTPFTVINQYEKVSSLRFQQCFGPLTMLIIEGSSEKGLFRHLSTHVFGSP